jgi:beta-1,4-mannosyl-glycoprotein beta-1,4-N-acetylglucosaminyltransferase
MVYDCFTFFNEHDLLEIRLNTLDSVVDYFVIVEANRTFTNMPKEFEFYNNRNRFKSFEKKIIHIMVDDFPEYSGDPWVFERFQRNAIMRGLKDCKQDDTIIISDVDEIPAPKAVNSCLIENASICLFEQKSYYAYVNCINIDDAFWAGPVSLPFKRLSSPEYVRSHRISYKYSYLQSHFKKIFYLATMNFNRYIKWQKISKSVVKNPVIIKNAGWHFSYCGGVGKIILKIKSFSHQEINTGKNVDPDYIKSQIANGTIATDSGKNKSRIKVVEIDTNYPDYLYLNQNKYKHLIYDATNR